MGNLASYILKAMAVEHQASDRETSMPELDNPEWSGYRWKGKIVWSLSALEVAQKMQSPKREAVFVTYSPAKSSVHSKLFLEAFEGVRVLLSGLSMTLSLHFGNLHQEMIDLDVLFFSWPLIGWLAVSDIVVGRVE